MKSKDGKDGEAVIHLLPGRATRDAVADTVTVRMDAVSIQNGTLTYVVGISTKTLTGAEYLEKMKKIKGEQ